MRTTPALAVALLVVLAALAAPTAAGAAESPASTGAAASPQSAAPSPQSTAPLPQSTATSPKSATPSPQSTAGTTASAVDEHDACAPVSTGSPREHPDADRLGYERGCWYDEPLSIERADGLNRTELEAVVARTQARVERIRQLEFVEPVTVTTMARETYRNRTAGLFANLSEADRLHQNVKYEATFLVGEDTDAIVQLRENRAGGILGYYDPATDRIVVITDGGTADVDEFTLAHELVHALQDQQFNLSRYHRSTTEGDNALSGLIEGDANYVEHHYRQRCEGGWQCPEPGGAASAPPGFHFGLYFLQYQPYSDGPAFVESLRDEGGWEAVNAAYDDPPESTEQVIHPERYPDDEPANVTVEDRSDERWRVLQLEGGVNYASFGEAGMFTMLYYPAYESRGDRSVIPINHLFNDGSGRQLDPYNYDHRYSAGWDGDRLYPYVTNDSGRTNETGYVWKTVWDTEDEAREFAAGYVQLLEAWGADPVDGRVNTFRISESGPYGDAFYIDRTDDTVVVVNAPDPANLSRVRAGAAPEVEPMPTATRSDGVTPTDDSTPGIGTPGDDPGADPTPSATPTSEDPTPTDPDGPPNGGTGQDGSTSADGGADGNGTPPATETPGFGVAAALAALVALFGAVRLLGRRRR